LGPHREACRSRPVADGLSCGSDHRWPLARAGQSPLWQLVLELRPCLLAVQEWATVHRTPLRTLERMIRGSLLLGRGVAILRVAPLGGLRFEWCGSLRRSTRPTGGLSGPRGALGSNGSLSPARTGTAIATILLHSHANELCVICVGTGGQGCG
jgi:hypothetical protein